MKRISFLCVCVAALLVGLSPTEVNGDLIPPVSDESPSPDTVTRTEWDIFLQALVMVESEGNPNAVGKTNDVGILQITPIYVKEVNRILKEERYTLADRTNPDKSVEMFSVMQDYWNPDHDIELAIHLHNPGAGDWYRKRILSRMETIKEEESCQQES